MKKAVIAPGIKSVFRYVAAPAPRYMMRLSLIRNMLKLLPENMERFLEIGPGMGDLSLYLMDLFPDITGDVIDISQKSIAIVAQRKGVQDRLRLHNKDFFSVDFTESYDLVIACEVFEHIQNDAEAFDKVRRLLRRNGYFMLSVPALMAKWSTVDLYAGHVRRYERKELMGKVERHGFKIIRFWSYGYPITPLTGPISRIYYRMLQRKKKLSRMDSTKRSGTERSLAARFPAIPVSILMGGFFWIQDKLKTSDLGDGFLILATRDR